MPDSCRTMMHLSSDSLPAELRKAVVVDFPLRGEWAATSTPAERIPSHGTDYFAQRYAYDFYRLTSDGVKPYSAPISRHVFGSIPAESCLCWNAPVLSAFAGVVVGARDGWPDRRRLSFLPDMLGATFSGARPHDDDFRPLTGNYVIIEGEKGFAMYGHLRDGSVLVRDGERVEKSQLVGAVGNSGNSSMPHLHFQLQSGPDPRTATAVPCAFTTYERFHKGTWQRVTDGFPGALERIRLAAPNAKLSAAAAP